MNFERGKDPLKTMDIRKDRELKKYLVLTIDQDDSEDSSVTVIEAADEMEAFKKYITDEQDMDIEDEGEMDMVKQLLNDNPLLIGEMKGVGRVIFDQFFGDNLEDIGINFDNEE